MICGSCIVHVCNIKLNGNISQGSHKKIDIISKQSKETWNKKKRPRKVREEKA